MVFNEFLVISNTFHSPFIFGCENSYKKPLFCEHRFLRIPRYIEQKYFFLIFINDIPEGIQSNIQIFADDT